MDDSIPVGSLSLIQIELSRKQMHERIDAQYDELVLRILTEGKRITLDDGEQLLPLTTDPARFKGMKPSLLLFPDGGSVTVQNWRRAILEILWIVIKILFNMNE